MQRRRIDPATGEPVTGAPVATTPPPAPRRRRVDPGTGAPVEEGGISGMKGTDWTALLTRVIPGLLSNAGGIPGALIGGASEFAAQLQEGEMRPWKILSQAGVGAVPFGKLVQGGIKGAGALASAGNVALGAGKGAVVNTAADTIDKLISEGRLPTGSEFKTDALLGAGAGGLASGVVRGVQKLRSGAQGVQPSLAPEGPAQGSLFDAPPSRPAPRPRVLRGKDMYAGEYPQHDPTSTQFRGQRPPVVPEIGPEGPRIQTLAESQMDPNGWEKLNPYGRPQPDDPWTSLSTPQRRQSPEDLLEELLGIEPRVLRGRDMFEGRFPETSATDDRFSPRTGRWAQSDDFGANTPVSAPRPVGQPAASVATAPEDPVDILTEVMGTAGYRRAPVGSTGARPDVSGKVGLMDRMRETADMGRGRLTSVGEPEVLAPMRPGEDRFSRPVGGAQSGQAPGAGMNEDDMVAELLGLPPRNLDIPEGPLVKPPAMPAAAPMEDIAADVATLPAAEQAAVIRKFSELAPEEGRELRRILAEMREFRFERGVGAEDFETMQGERIDRRQGWRGGLLQHTAGAPVFHDIMGGTKGTRASVIGALERFIEQGGRPTAITQRTIDVAKRRLAGEWGLSKPTLPPDAGMTLEERLADVGAEPAFPPSIPDEIVRLHESLRPKWQATNDALRADGVPDEIIGEPESLTDFARRLASEPTRELMGAERKVMASLPEDKLEMLRRLLMGDEGSVNPDLAYDLGAMGAGAVAAPIIEGTTDDPAVSAIGGAAMGLGLKRGIGAGRRALSRDFDVAARGQKELGGLGQLLERIQSSSLFSGAAQLKSALGNIGGLGWYTAEHPRDAGRVLRETFSPETGRAIKEGFNRPMVREAGAAPIDSPFSYPGRAIGAVDEGARDIIRRVRGTPKQQDLPGVPPTPPDFGNVGGQYTLSGDPASPMGEWLIKGAEHPAARVLAPVMRTPINFIERGVERLPGIGALPSVRSWTGGGDKSLANRRQLLGLLALLGGGAAGAAASESDALPYMAAAAGPYGLPVAMGAKFGQTVMRNKRNSPLEGLGAMFEEIQSNVPLSNDYSFDLPRNLRRLVPYGAALRALSPISPNEFDTSRSIFGPAVAQVPFVNQALLNRKRKARPRVQFTRRDP